MRRFLPNLILISFGLLLSPFSHAIPEKDYQQTYTETILPFLKSGQRIQFESADEKWSLDAVRFVNPKPKGILIVVNGHSEPWLKYGEVFYDFYQLGYTIYSYDHRGQGRSPHLVPKYSQIGHLDEFVQYTKDLKQFVDQVIKVAHPREKNLFLLAHSMGGAVVAQYLENYPSLFQSVALTAPMFQINTSPYPEFLARTIGFLYTVLGFGDRYVIGKHDDDCSRPFESSRSTGSAERWWMGNFICKIYPETMIGGPSNAWLNQALKATKSIRANASQIETKVLMFQAGIEHWVVNSAGSEACSKMQNCRLVTLPTAKHEILMENDSIRDRVIRETDAFFSPAQLNEIR